MELLTMAASMGQEINLPTIKTDIIEKYEEVLSVQKVQVTWKTLKDALGNAFIKMIFDGKCGDMDYHRVKKFYHQRSRKS